MVWLLVEAIGYKWRVIIYSLVGRGCLNPRALKLLYFGQLQCGDFGPEESWARSFGRLLEPQEGAIISALMAALRSCGAMVSVSNPQPCSGVHEYRCTATCVD